MPYVQGIVYCSAFAVKYFAGPHSTLYNIKSDIQNRVRPSLRPTRPGVRAFTHESRYLSLTPKKIQPRQNIR